MAEQSGHRTLGPYTVVIEGSSQVKEGVVSLPHEMIYAIILHNKNTVQVDAVVSIDGECVGTFRLEPKCTRKYTRGANDERTFVFLKETSADAQSAGIEKGHEENGLVSVVFKPECKPQYLDYDGMDERRSRMSGGGASRGGGFRGGSEKQTLSVTAFGGLTRGSSYSSGATGYGSKSNQKFESVPKLKYDVGGIRTITLRIVCQEAPKEKPKYEAVAPRATSVPPRVEDMEAEMFGM